MNDAHEWDRKVGKVEEQLYVRSEDRQSWRRSMVEFVFAQWGYVLHPGACAETDLALRRDSLTVKSSRLWAMTEV